MRNVVFGLDWDHLMRVLLLCQVFHPDVVAVAQYVTDLGQSLAAADHEVTVICSSRG